MNVRPLDITILAAYFVLTVGLGVWVGRKNRSTEDYFVGGRGMPGWLVGISILGTCISSVSYVAYPGMAFAHDWQYLVQGLMLPVVLVCGGLAAVTFYRRHIKTSVNEFLEERFGPGIRLFSMAVLLVSEVTRVAIVLYLFSLVVHTVTGLPIVAVILAIGIITIGYAVVGGIQGVIWTDFIQTIVLFSGGLVTIIAVSLSVDGGFGQVMSEAWTAGKFKLFDFTPSLKEDAFIVLALSGLTNFFYFLAGNQNQVQRYQCASSDEEAKKAAVLGSLLSVPTWMLFLLVGTCLFVFYQHNPDPDITAYLAADKADKVFPHFMVTQLPAGLSGLLLAGLFGAAMSTLDSSMNAASTLAVTDVYRRFISPDATEERAFLMARILTLIWGLIGVALAILMIKLGTFLEFYFKIASLILGSATGVFFLALASKRAHSRGVIIGIVVGIVLTLWGAFTWAEIIARDSALAFPWHMIMIGVAACFAVIVIGLLSSLVIPEDKGDKG